MFMASQPKNIDHQSESRESKAQPDEQFSEEEAGRRRDAVVRRMLETPPKPRNRPMRQDKRPPRKDRGRKSRQRV